MTLRSRRDQEPIDVLIVTAVKEEYDAVLEVSAGAISPSWETRPGPTGLEIGFRTFTTKTGTLRFAVTRALEMGGVATANAAAPLVHEYRPRCLAMCGVCAGHRGKIALGDVIVADRLWTYDTGSTVLETDEATGQDTARFKADSYQYQLTSSWRQRAESFRPDDDAQWLTQRPRSHEDQANWLLVQLGAGRSPTQDERNQYCRDYTEIIKNLWTSDLLYAGEVRLTQAGRKQVAKLHVLYPDGLPEPAPFKVQVGPIGTGSALVRDDRIFEKLSERMRKVLGLEMEAAAIGAIADLHDVDRMIVMKGVMDFADRNKSDNFKAFAARASAECLIAFLRENLKPANPDDGFSTVREGDTQDAGGQSGSRLAHMARTPILNFITERTGLPDHPRPFGGRADLMAALDAWVHDAASAPYQLITAPGGGGKSTLLIKWWQTLPKEWSVAFVPVSKEVGTNERGHFFRVLAASLSSAIGVPEGYDLSEEEARSRIELCLRKPRAPSNPLIVIIDGLDELHRDEWSIWRQLFPLIRSDFHRQLRVLVSARPVLGDKGSLDWMNRLGWSRATNVARPVLELKALGPNGIGEVLDASGMTDERLGAEKRATLVKELLRLTVGDPLILGLYVDDLSRDDGYGLLTRERLPEIPSGENSFFREWFRQLDLNSAAQGREAARMMRTMLHIMATALGPLTADDFSRVLTDDERLHSLGVLQDLAPVARFVSGSGKPDDGYKFTHARFTSFFLDTDMTAEERRSNEQRFLAAGAKLVGELETGASRAGGGSPYFMRFFSGHLARANRPPAEFLTLASEAWLRAWMALDPSGRGPLRDLETAAFAARRLNDAALAAGELAPWLGVEIKFALCKVSLLSRAYNVTPILVGEAFKRSLIDSEQAIELGIKQKDESERFDIFMAILNVGLSGESRQAVVDAAYDAYKGGYGNSQQLEALIPHLSEEIIAEIGDSALATKFMRHRISSSEVERFLDGLEAKSQPTSRDYEFLAQIAAIVERPMRARILPLLEPARSETNEVLARLLESWTDPPGEKLAKLLAGALVTTDFAAAAARTVLVWRWLSDDVRHASLDHIATLLDEMDGTWTDSAISVAAALLPLVPTPLQEALVEQVTKIFSPVERLKAFGKLRPVLQGALRESVVRTAIAILVNLVVNHENLRAQAPFFPDLPDELKAFWLDDLTEEIEGMNAADVCAAIADHCRDEWREKAVLRGLNVVGRASTAYRAAFALERLAPLLLSETTIARGLEVARGIRLGRARASALSHLLPFLPESSKDEIVRLGLEASREIDDWYSCFGLLAVLGSGMPADRVEEALQAAARFPSVTLRAFGMASLLGAVSAEVKSDLVDRILSIVGEAESGYRQAKILEALIPHLGAAHLSPALALALTIDEEASSSWEAASAIAMVLKMEPAPTRASLVAELSKKIGPTSFADVLRKIGEIPVGRLRCDALIAIAPLVGAKFSAESVACAYGIEERHLRALALGELAIYLPFTLAVAACSDALDLTVGMPAVLKAVALAPVVAMLPDDVADEIANTLLKPTGFSIDYIHRKRRAKKLFAERASAALRARVLQRALTCVRGDDAASKELYRDHDVMDAREVLEALLPYLGANEASIAENALSKVLPRSRRGRAGAELARIFPTLGRGEALSRLRSIVESATERGDLSKELKDAMPVIAALGDRHVGCMVCRDLSFVTRCWP